MSTKGSIHRQTRQRQVILEEVRKTKTHPTASEVYDMVRQYLPKISLATVYRNLEFLAESGLLLKLEVAGTEKHFDATTTEHYHIRCEQCGRIDDVDIPVMTSLVKKASKVTSYQVTGHHVEFVGICSDCLKAAQIEK